ncbi:MAG: acyltransferase [Candidatus Methanoperedens sp.]|nr:acyltransferase [Candidatus Methanoperedens sp.]
MDGLLIPDYTVMEEHSIVVEGDVLVGNYADLSFGLIANTIVAGEHVKVKGNIISENDVRIDMWSEITGDVRTKTDAYLGEFVKINGKLTAAGNLDVGNNVKISEGYDIKGWLVVRNPLPFIMFIFFYLMALLHLGNEEEVEKALGELFSEEVSYNRVMTIPGKTRINLLEINTTSSAVIGNNCRITGNVVSRSLAMGKHVVLFGSIRTSGVISIGAGSTVHGNLVSREMVKIGRNCHVLGKIAADSVIMHETAKVDGTLTTLKGTTIEKDDIEGLNEIETKLFYGFTLLEHA